jgi:hypothetical protein
MKKELFWLRASEFSVNGQLAPYLGYHETEYHGDEQSCSLHGSQEAETDRQEGVRDTIPFKDPSPVSYFL